MTRGVKAILMVKLRAALAAVGGPTSKRNSDLRAHVREHDPDLLARAFVTLLVFGVVAWRRDGGRKPGLGRMAKAKSIGWAIYVAGFVIWLLVT